MGSEWPDKRDKTGFGSVTGLWGGLSNGTVLPIKKWSKTYPWLRTISWSWAHFYALLKNFSPNIPLVREFFPQNTPLFCLKTSILGSFAKSIPLSKAFGRKIYPWLRNFCPNAPLAKESGLKKMTLGGGTPQKAPSPQTPTPTVFFYFLP